MKTILMIEDEAMLAELFGEYVQLIPESEFLGAYSDAAKAYSTCLEKKPDAIVLDIRLPGVNGLEMLTRLRRDVPQAKVIVFSGSLDAHSVRMALEGDAHGFVEKAHGMAELNKGIMCALEGGRYYSSGAQDYVNRLKKDRED
jgi:DNA-binding NarL/FixJ family response regulator